MKKLSLVLLLVLSLLVFCFQVPATAQSEPNSVKRNLTITGDTKTKAKTKTTTKTLTKTATKAKTNSNTAVNSATKKSSTKTKSAVTKPKPTSRGGSKSFDVSRILSVGMSLKGTPYKYGGRSTKGFDCSGFTSYVFEKAAGITLPRTSGGQASAGTPVSKANLEPGDLVYFNTNGKSISHVGIYVGGDNFIHASSTKGITVTSLNDTYYKTRYRGATRVR